MDRLLLKYQSYPFTVRLAGILLLAMLFSYWTYVEAVIPAQESVTAAKAQSDKLVEDIKRVNVADKKAEETERKIQDTEKELNEMRELLPSDLDTEKLLRAFADQAREVGVEINKFTPDSQFSAEKSNPQSFAAPVAPQGPPSVAAAPGKAPGAPGQGAAPPNQAGPAGMGSGLGPQAGLEGFHETEVSLEVTGYFSQVVEFIDRALSMQRILKLKSVDFSKAPENLQNADASSAAAGTAVKAPKLNAKISFVSFVQLGQEDAASKMLQMSAQSQLGIPKTMPGKPMLPLPGGAGVVSSGTPPEPVRGGAAQ